MQENGHSKVVPCHRHSYGFKPPITDKKRKWVPKPRKWEPK